MNQLAKLVDVFGPVHCWIVTQANELLCKSFFSGFLARLEHNVQDLLPGQVVTLESDWLAIVILRVQPLSSVRGHRCSSCVELVLQVLGQLSEHLGQARNWHMCIRRHKAPPISITALVIPQVGVQLVHNSLSAGARPHASVPWKLVNALGERHGVTLCSINQPPRWIIAPLCMRHAPKHSLRLVDSAALHLIG